MFLLNIPQYDQSLRTQMRTIVSKTMEVWGLTYREEMTGDRGDAPIGYAIEQMARPIQDRQRTRTCHTLEQEARQAREEATV